MHSFVKCLFQDTPANLKYSVEMFSRALATIEFIMVRCRLLSIAELSSSCSDLAQCIFKACT